MHNTHSVLRVISHIFCFTMAVPFFLAYLVVLILVPNKIKAVLMNKFVYISKMRISNLNSSFWGIIPHSFGVFFV